MISQKILSGWTISQVIASMVTDNERVGSFSSRVVTQPYPPLPDPKKILPLELIRWPKR